MYHIQKTHPYHLSPSYPECRIRKRLWQFGQLMCLLRYERHRHSLQQ